MLGKLLGFFRHPFGISIGIKRPNENPEDDVIEPPRKQRKIEKPELERFFTSNQFLRPSDNWKVPKKRPMIHCRQQQQQQQRPVDASQPLDPRTAPQPGSSWFETSKENVIEVPDDEDPDVLGVWQDAKTLRKRPIFRTAGSTNKTDAALVDLSADDDDDDAGDTDIQVIKVVESHASEIAQSGNTMSIFQTPSGRVPVLSRHFATQSDNVKKSEGVMQRLKSVCSSSSEEGNGSRSGTLSTINRTEEKKLALYEPFKLDEKRQYLELLQKFTDVPLQAQYRHRRSIWNTCSRTVPQKGERTLSFDYAASAREKLNPIFIDLTKPEQGRSLSRNRISVCRDREAEPSTSASKQEEDVPETQKFPFSRSNSLAATLKSNFFCREDLITSIDEKYRRKREARERQEEEEKLKVLHFKQREDRLHMEAIERLTDYLKIRDGILDESYIEEEKVTLPELTADMQRVIDAALIPRPSNEVLVEAFGLAIKRHDMHTLADLNWLNDEVINFYMELLKERGKLENYPSVYTFNTFFYPRLLSGGHAALKRWTRKVDIFSHDLIIVPVHLGVHWCLAAIDFQNKTVKYYDSMGSSNNKCLQSVMKYLQDESLDKKKKPFDTSDWKTENVQNIPQQMNGSDCGMFACTFAEYLCRGADVTFTQQDMPYFRHKMVYEICKSKLLM